MWQKLNICTQSQHIHDLCVDYEYKLLFYSNSLHTCHLLSTGLILTPPVINDIQICACVTYSVYHTVISYFRLDGHLSMLQLALDTSTLLGNSWRSSMQMC